MNNCLLPDELVVEIKTLPETYAKVALLLGVAYCWPKWPRPLQVQEIAQITGMQWFDARRALDDILERRMITSRLSSTGLGYELADRFMEYRKQEPHQNGTKLDDLAQKFAEILETYNER